MITVHHITESYISEVLAAVPLSRRPGAEHLACTVCGGSFRSPLSIVQQCEHCNGVGMEPVVFKIDLEKFCSRHPLPGYDRDAIYARFSHFTGK